MGEVQIIIAGPRSMAHFIDRLRPLYERQLELAHQMRIEEQGLADELGLSGISTYVVACPSTRLVKIGKAADVRARIRALQIGSASRLQLLRTIPFDCEQRMHVRFGHLRQHGEWFRFDIEMLTEAFNEDIIGRAKAMLEMADAD